MPPNQRVPKAKSKRAGSVSQACGRRARGNKPAAAGGRKVKNARKATPAQRAERSARSLNAFADELVSRNGPVQIPITWLSSIVGILLIPLVGVTMETFFRSLAQVTVNHEFWRTAPFWFFHLGIALWIVVLSGLRGPKMIWIYVLGHEYTHAAFALACGGKILKAPIVTARGGEVVTTKNNVLISLSPYFVPFYSVIAALIYGGLQLLFEFGAVHERAFFSAIGFTWAFHMTFTFLMVLRSQPDLQQYGTFFSLVIIILINVLIISGLFVTASPTVNWSSFGQAWWQNVRELAILIRDGLATGWQAVSAATEAGKN